MTAGRDPRRGVLAPLRLKLALGPVLYYWPRETILDFYAGLPHAALATIYLGEVVCGRRHELRPADWLGLARDLRSAGPEIILSTQSLIESDADLRAMRHIVDNGEFAVEANEMGAVRLLAGRARFVAGPHLNVYNPDTLDWLARLGAYRWAAPIEMSCSALARFTKEMPAGMQTEVWGYGRLPLAFSARCFTARHFNLPKDDCQYRCSEHADGLPLDTREGKPFLVLNGIQTQSAHVQDLLVALGEMPAVGVGLVRLSPHSAKMNEVIDAFARVIEGSLDASAAEALLNDFRPAARCDGYWYGRAGMDHVAA